MLKWYSRDGKGNGLNVMAYTIPTLAEMVPVVNDMTVRDFRKNKIENILCNNGQFWFTEGTPQSMFPRNMADDRIIFNIIAIPIDIFRVAILRIGHIHFMTNFVIKFPREVYSVKKMINAFDPTPQYDDEQSKTLSNEEDRFIPNMRNTNSKLSALNSVITRKGRDTKLLSALRARAWLNFLIEILKRLNTNYNDRNELNKFLSGANNILLEHSCDFGIVGQTLVLYMTIVTRFRRLFDANRGYSIFIPTLFKVFCETEKVQPIRTAIITVWGIFFRVHGESFIFQALGCLTP
ncbi:35490_t:CDS:1, partial [Racocetra persica]